METLRRYYEEGRLIRWKWSDRALDGRELLCLYTAMLGDPEARPGGCPANVCPLWLAHLIPWIDDFGSEEKWPEVVRRFVAAAPKLASLPASAEFQVRALIVREAMRHTAGKRVLRACEQVVALCERAAAGDMPPQGEWAAAAKRARRDGAWAAAQAAEAAAAQAAREAAERAAREAAAQAAREAAERAAREAAAQAAREAAERAAREAAERAAESAACDRIIEGILAILESA